MNNNEHTLNIASIYTPAQNVTSTDSSDHLYDGGDKVIGQ